MRVDWERNNGVGVLQVINHTCSITPINQSVIPCSTLTQLTLAGCPVNGITVTQTLTTWTALHSSTLLLTHCNQLDSTLDTVLHPTGTDQSLIQHIQYHYTHQYTTCNSCRYLQNEVLTIAKCWSISMILTSHLECNSLPNHYKDNQYL